MSELYHIGNRNSGRYPRGSGENPRAERGKKGRKSSNKPLDKKEEKALIKQLKKPRYTAAEMKPELEKILKKYPNPYQQTPEKAALIADKLMRETNNIVNKSQKAIAKGDLRLAVELQKRSFAYAQAAQEALAAEEYLYNKYR